MDVRQKDDAPRPASRPRGSVRPAAVAGLFYPEREHELRDEVKGLLGRASSRGARRPPKALVVPHAGYVYSGELAAAGFASLRDVDVERVVLLGPAHRVWTEGAVAPRASFMATPLGDVAIDSPVLEDIGVRLDDAPHAREHALEVELPFLQILAPRARVVPLVVGRAAAADVCALLLRSWGGPETIIVVSSDLSHGLPYESARGIDRQTADQIVELGPAPVASAQACGAAALNGFFLAARARAMRGELLDLRSSGDTHGPRDAVVGYGAFAFHEGAS